jgi:hypothetical protein
VKTGRIRMSESVDSRRKFTFSLPSGIPNEFPMITTFLLVSSNNLRMRIEFNGTVISDREYTDGPERAIHEFVDHVSFSTDIDHGNALIFTVLQGEALLRDVILWFQREI